MSRLGCHWLDHGTHQSEGRTPRSVNLASGRTRATGWQLHDWPADPQPVAPEVARVRAVWRLISPRGTAAAGASHAPGRRSTLLSVRTAPWRASSAARRAPPAILMRVERREQGARALDDDAVGGPEAADAVNAQTRHGIAARYSPRPARVAGGSFCFWATSADVRTTVAMTAKTRPAWWVARASPVGLRSKSAEGGPMIGRLHGFNASRRAQRDPMSSFAKTLLRCHSTVRRLRNSSAPISGLVRPSAARRAMRASCAVNSSRPPTVRLRTVSPVASAHAELVRRRPRHPCRRTSRWPTATWWRASTRRPCLRNHSP